MPQYPLLDGIHNLSDFERIADADLAQLASEMRDFMIQTVSRTGGHLASSLGAVELIIALHRVFHAPKETIIFDVGHQSYAHKMLTGRKDTFETLRQHGGISGFPKREESVYDAFNTGHSSTSISAALGMVRASAIKGEEHAAVAVIGDGALTGGMAFEALNDAGHSTLPLIVVINDNEMSISKNVGALNWYLNEMRASNRYQSIKRSTVRVLDSSALGKRLSKRMERLKNRIKYFLLPNVMFEAMGFTYLGPIDGHDIHALIHVLEKARDLHRPVIVHAVTQKGKGYRYAEQNPEKFHGIAPFDVETGKLLHKEERSNSDVFGQQLVRLAQKDERIVAITAAMPIGTGLSAFERRFPNRFFDVGIAEQHAVTMAAGMAAEGLRPVVAIYSTFLQRAYDQILHDVCLQDLPVVFAIDRAGLVGSDGETHQGVYDIAYCATFPKLTMYAPASQEELEQMLAYALSRQEPSAIRYGRAPLMHELNVAPVVYGKWKPVFPIAQYTILACGNMLEAAIPIAQKWKTGLINACFLDPLDEEMLETLKATARGILTIEDGIVNLGFGSRVALKLGATGVKVRSLGVPLKPILQGSITQQRHECGLSPEQIEQALVKLMEEV